MSEEEKSSEEVHLQCVAAQSIPREYSSFAGSHCFRRRRSRKRSIGGLPVNKPDLYDDSEIYEFDVLSEPKIPCAENSNCGWKGYNAKMSRTLPLLMYERELYGRGGGHPVNRIYPWKTRLLQKQTRSTNAVSRKAWRPYCTQSLKFQQLGTSLGDAVLGLDPTGSYVVSLGEEQTRNVTHWNEGEENFGENNRRQSLMLRFSAVPKSKGEYCTKAKQLLSIPLRDPSSTGTSDPESFFDDESLSWMCAPVRIPVRLWMCSDGRLGACMYRTSRTSSVSIVVFPLPGAMARSDELLTYHHVKHVHAPCQAKQDLSPTRDGNLLVRTRFLPCSNPSDYPDNGRSWLCNAIMEGVPSYLFLVDEEDGFRLIWIKDNLWNTGESNCYAVEALWQNGEKMQHLSKSDSWEPLLVRSTMDSRIVVQVSNHDAGWERIVYDPLSEISSSHDSESYIGAKSKFKISFTGFLCVASLLQEILVRRPHLITPRFCGTKAKLPIFTYHLVQVSIGRIAEILLVFSVGGAGRGCRGVFVEVDLLTQDYRELEWLRHGASDAPPADSGILAYNRRRKKCNNAIPNDQKVGMDFLLDEMYPDSVTMDNLAVRIQIPVMSLCARSAPVQVVYC